MRMTLPNRRFCGVILVGVVLSWFGGVWADEGVEPLSPAEHDQASRINNVFRRAAEQVMPAVVFVKVSKSAERGFFSHGDPRPGLGSGCIIDNRGYVITNNHVVSDTDHVEVVLADGRRFSAEEVLMDPDTDLAVIRIDPEGQELPVAVLGDSEEARVGDFALAIGSPFGLEQTITAGIISYKGRQTHILDRKWGYEDFIQTDADINRGNSGGPLVNLHGQVIGINSMIISQTGTSAGLGFAIPSNIVKFVAGELMENGKVRRGYLGVELSGLTLRQLRRAPAEQLDRAYGRGFGRFLEGVPESVEGVLTGDVLEDGPAGQAGMKKWDIILSVNGKRTLSSKKLRTRIAVLGPGAEVRCRVWRDGKELELDIRLADRAVAKAKSRGGELTPPTWAERRDLDDRFGRGRPGRAPSSEGPKVGVTVRDLGEDLAEYLGYDAGTKGVVITDVAEGSLAQQGGLQVGDIILSVDGEDVTTIEQLARIIQDTDLANEGIELVVRNHSGEHRRAIKPGGN